MIWGLKYWNDFKTGREGNVPLDGNYKSSKSRIINVRPWRSEETVYSFQRNPKQIKIWEVMDFRSDLSSSNGIITPETKLEEIKAEESYYLNESSIRNRLGYKDGERILVPGEGLDSSQYSLTLGLPAHPPRIETLGSLVEELISPDLLFCKLIRGPMNRDPNSILRLVKFDFVPEYLEKDEKLAQVKAGLTDLTRKYWELPK